MVSLNQGGVAQLSAIALNSAGSQVPADLTFTSSNTAFATISSGGLICGGIWDSSIINCNATLGQAGVGKVTITATATADNVTATATVYVHERVDQVQCVITNSCTSAGQPVTLSGKAFSTSAPGCSPASPCDITNTVGPFTFGTNNATVAASSSGIVSTVQFNLEYAGLSLTAGRITGAKGDTCDIGRLQRDRGRNSHGRVDGQEHHRQRNAVDHHSSGIWCDGGPNKRHSQQWDCNLQRHSQRADIDHDGRHDGATAWSHKPVCQRFRREQPRRFLHHLSGCKHSAAPVGRFGNVVLADSTKHAKRDSGRHRHRRTTH